jgi:hypothetical protein
VQPLTQLKVGILINQVVPDIQPGLTRNIVIALLGVYSHAILDALSPLTYHPSDPSPKDRFWLGYHIALTALSLRCWMKQP